MQPTPRDDDDLEVDLRGYALVVWRRLWVILLCTAVAVATAFLVSRAQPKVYESTATLLINQASGLTAQTYSDITTNQQLAMTYSQLVGQRPILQAAIGKLGLSISPEQLSKALTVRVVPNTMLMRLTARSSDPPQAAAIANTVAQVFIESNQQTQGARFSDERKALQGQISSLEEKMRTTATQLDQLRAAQDSRTAETRQAETSRLQNLLSQYQITYSQLIRSDQDVQLAETKALGGIAVTEPAVPPITPVSPKTAQNVLAAALIGLMLGVAIVFVLEWINNTVKSTEDVRRAIGAPCLGSIPWSKELSTGEPVPQAPGSLDSPASEAFRMVRTNLQFTLMGRPKAALLFSSALPAEGKSTTVSNLAQVLAQQGRHVILVDADLRRPRVHHSFRLRNAAGLTTLLLQPGPIDWELFHPTSHGNLMVLTSGPLPPNPSELLGSSRMAEVVEVLKGSADVVLFDCPPVLAATDSIVLANLVDGVVLVTDSRKTRPRSLIEAAEALARGAGSAKLLGVVLNKLTLRPHEGYYYYQYTASQEDGSRPRRRIGRNGHISGRAVSAPAEKQI